MAMLPSLIRGVMTMPCIFNTENMAANQYHELVFNNPEWFLFHCRAGGYEFEVVNDSLKIIPLHAIDDEMRNLLKLHKRSLITLLESELNNGD